MPRPLRILYANAWYHVMNRGAGRGNIFKNNTHRLIFLELLDECSEMFNINVHAYCLMDNHYHLLIRTPDANLSRAMRHLNGVYTQRFNRLQKTDGPLFRGRYKSQLIEEDCYLLIVSRYIHLNPVEAGIVAKPCEYRWSSYPAYIGVQRCPVWLSTDIILNTIKNTHMLSHVKNYQEYVESMEIDEINIFSSVKITDPILGSKKFKERIISQLNEDIMLACASDINRAKVVVDIEFIIMKFCDFYKIDRGNLINTKRGTLNWPRLVFMYVCRKYFGYTLRKISVSLGSPYRSTISTGIHQCKRRLLKQPELEEEVALILEELM